MIKSIQTREEILKKLKEKNRQFIVSIILSNQKIAEELQIKTIDLQCLNIIELLEEESTPGRIAKILHLTTGGVTIMLDRLEKKGYIQRSPNPHDRRSIIIRIPEDRKEKLHKIYNSRENQMDKLLSNYSEEELSIIIDYFSKLTENTSK